MFDKGGGKKYSASRWHFYYDFQIPEDEMAAPMPVIISKGRDGAPTIRQVSLVSVLAADGLWPEVNCNCREHPF
jgi:hypothetical protein